MNDPGAPHVKRLQEAIEKAAEFRSQGLSSWTPTFRAWREKAIQSLAGAGAKAGYRERFESLGFNEPYVSPNTRLFDSKPGTFDEDLQLAQDVIKDALEDLPAAPVPSKKEVDMLVTGHGGQGGNAPWYDVAQVCLSGHLINDRAKSSPQHNQAFCGKCGKATIMACPKCNAPLRGYYHVPRVVALGASDFTAGFCLACGAPYPWTAEKLEAARAYADEADGLSPEEKETLKMSFDDLIVDSPKTQLAAIRFKKLLPKVGQQIGGALRDLLIDIVSEAAKKALWP